ncbi:glycosyltransferase [Anaerococcus sp.]|uniref:glycosyltransferase n=1 Tax=Anaerococcus sp. TaxID=1872515 RepID=UPI0027BA473E|nr:glycosyltransferase [Anaerococcus sp.]
MKKIVFFIERLSTGGAERVVSTLANEISKSKNYEVYVITYLKKEMNEYQLSKNVHRIEIIKPNGGRFSTIYNKYLQIKDIVKELNPFCVFSLAIPKTNAVLMAALWRRNFPLIISERNDPNRFPAKKSMKMLRNFIYKRCDGIVFQTPGARDYFKDILKCKTTVVPNPISTNLPKRYEGTREKNIVNFCRIEPQKNIKLLIYAFSDVDSNLIDYTLEIYGEGSQKKELEEYVNKKNLDNRVIFHGYSSNIHEKILKAGLFVSSSNYEGISNSMLESMSIGIPTICTDCPPGGAKSIINNGENGILVPVGDAKKMTEAINLVLNNKLLQDELSKNASKISLMLQPKIIARRWLNFMEGVNQL